LRNEPALHLRRFTLQPPLTCRSSGSSSSGSSSAGVHSKPWMLDALRFAIHIRRGDVVTDGWTERILSTQYYINLAKAVTQVRLQLATLDILAVLYSQERSISVEILQSANCMVCMHYKHNFTVPAGMTLRVANA
jgi:hypothetical protein